MLITSLIYKRLLACYVLARGEVFVTVKPRTLKTVPVVIVADWDADGATSAALIYYSQYYKKVYPLKGRHEVYLEPAGPRSLSDAVKSFLDEYGCPSVLVVLDIPFTERVRTTLYEYAKDCSSSRLIYIDHHFSTLYAAKELYKLSEEVFLGHKPTTMLTFQLLRSLGIKHVTPRLTAFMKAVGILERGYKPLSEAENRIARIAASISKASTVLRDRELWRKLVKWLASPLPQDAPIDLTTIDRVLRIAEESDKEIMDKARDLAFAARRVGYIRFVDARNKWKGRGASALASKLYKILKQPIALLVERDDGVRLLIIRARRRGAYRVAVGLMREGVAENIGGHGGLAVVKLRNDVSDEVLLEKLRRLSLKL